MTHILQTTHLNSFHCMNIVGFWLKYRWNLFLRVQLTRGQHWFRLWFGTEQASSYYLKQWCPNILKHVSVTLHRWINYLHAELFWGNIKAIKNIVTIYHCSILIYHRSLWFTPKENILISHGQKLVCCWTGDLRSHGISSNSVDLVLSVYSKPSTRTVELLERVGFYRSK